MKRYIIWIIAAISLTTSCVVEEGYEHEPIAIGEAIATRGIDEIADYAHTFITIATIDEYLATDDEELREQLRTNYIGANSKIEQEGNNIIVSTTYYGQEYTLHNITTDGKALRDGGVWQSDNLRLFTTSNAITMVVTEPNNASYTADSASLNFENIEFNIEQGYSFNVSGSFVSRYGKGNNLNCEICKKLSFKDKRFNSGIIELRYIDEVNDYDDLVTVEYLDWSKIGISYLQYYKVVNNYII